jgi:hypothetical protein
MTMKLKVEDVSVSSFQVLPDDGVMAVPNTYYCPVPVYTKDGANTCYCSGQPVGCVSAGPYAC